MPFCYEKHFSSIEHIVIGVRVDRDTFCLFTSYFKIFHGHHLLPYILEILFLR
jgi:hypothetical protein